MGQGFAVATRGAATNRLLATQRQDFSSFRLRASLRPSLSISLFELAAAAVAGEVAVEAGRCGRVDEATLVGVVRAELFVELGLVAEAVLLVVVLGDPEAVERRDLHATFSNTDLFRQSSHHPDVNLERSGLK